MPIQRRLGAIAFALLITAAMGTAQTTNASIYGSISDSSGAAVAKAAVTAVNVKTGVNLSTVSNDAGVYIFPSLQPGEYTVTAATAGFRKAIAEHIQLDVSAKISVDLKLEVGATSESVTVESISSPIETVNTSVSNVVTQQRVQDLPLQNRDAGALIALQPGVVGDNFNGVRSQSQNVTLDGVNIQETRYNGGSGSGNLTTTNSVDLIDEFRVSTAPVDAEFGRGMAQVQMIGRSGTNQIRGSVFEFNRVTALSANTWFNNQLGRNRDGSLAAPRDFLIRNQYGARVGAPIVKNRTFVFFLYEAQRQKTKATLNNTTFTATGRQGIFRFFPGVTNGNAAASVPTVDLSGNPVAPAGAMLQTVSVFGRDPNRLVADPTGNVAIALKDYPLPNNFQRGDGLNTAGFFWQQPATNDNNLYHLRLDHNLTQNTRLAFSMQLERLNQFNGYRGEVFPNQPPDYARRASNFYVVSATTTIRPNLLNEFRAGVNRFKSGFDGPFYPSQDKVLPHVGSQPFFFNFSSGVSNIYTSNNTAQGRTSPLYQYSDTITWLKGRHAFKGGVQVYFDSSNGYNAFYVIPGANIGPGNVSYTNINTISGLSGSNLSLAQSMLGDLSGSLSSWQQAFNSAGGKNPTYIPGENNQRTWRQREYSGFFKDDWKVSSRLTLNLGVRYEYYSPAFEANGKSVIPVGGTAGAFGISGTSYADAFTPGAKNGSLTQLQLVGPGSNNPGTPVYNPQYNTFLPGVGLSWSLGKDNKTVFRAGYAMSSDRNSLRNADVEVGSNPGMNSTLSFTSGSLLNLSNVGVPFNPGQALATVPLTDRTQTLRVFDTGLRNQYYQNWNISLQRQVTKDSVLSVRYVGTKGSKLLNGVDLNADQIFTNGFLDAFKITRTGGQAPLFDKLFAGLTVGGKVVDGVNVRGSDYARADSTFAPLLANGNVGAFANNLNASKLLTNVSGGLLRAAGLPENFFVTNPQFASVYLVGNNANSTYHGMQVEYEKRFGQGWVYQGNYTWSKALGESELGGTQNYDYNYRNPQNRSFDKRIMTFNRTHVFKSNGIWELPVGRNQRLLRNANRLVDGLIGGWKVSGILTYTSGVPFTVTAPVSTFVKSTTGNTPDVIGSLSKGAGGLQFDGRGACYFCGFKQIADPNISLLASSLASRSTLFAQVGPGGVMLENPLPGTLGNLAQTFFTSPNFFNLDAAMTKQFKITERFNVEIRTDWLNATNHADFSTATIDKSIDSQTFGRFTSAGSNNNRIIVLGARFNF